MTWDDDRGRSDEATRFRQNFPTPPDLRGLASGASWTMPTALPISRRERWRRRLRRAGWCVAVPLFLVFAPWMRFEMSCLDGETLRTYQANTTREFSRALIEYLRPQDVSLADYILQSFRRGEGYGYGFYWRNPVDGQVYTTFWRMFFDWESNDLNAMHKTARRLLNDRTGQDSYDFVGGKFNLRTTPGRLCDIHEDIAFHGKYPGTEPRGR